MTNILCLCKSYCYRVLKDRKFWKLIQERGVWGSLRPLSFPSARVSLPQWVPELRQTISSPRHYFSFCWVAVDMGVTDGCPLTGRLAWWNPRLHVRPRWHDRLWLLSVPKEDQEDGKWHVCVWLMWQDIPEEQFPAATQIWAHRYAWLRRALTPFSAFDGFSVWIGISCGFQQARCDVFFLARHLFLFSMVTGLLNYTIVHLQTLEWIWLAVDAVAIMALSVLQGEVSHCHTHRKKCSERSIAWLTQVWQRKEQWHQIPCFLDVMRLCYLIQ